ncbi:hypothetical protein BZA77DRAFT_352215 [Pyronema omphalodes]|nr:hypothetical protein BZA77DRAFT_352215 [Pyronema omphalodes]
MEQWAVDKRIIINTRKNRIDRFRLLQPVPKIPDINDISARLSACIKGEEHTAILRMRAAITVASASCNTCSACTEKASLEGVRQETATGNICNDTIEAVMEDVPDLDTATLARLAIGAQALIITDLYRLIKGRQQDMKLMIQEQSTMRKRKFL